METTNCTIEVTTMEATAGTLVAEIVMRVTRLCTKIFYYIKEEGLPAMDLVNCRLLNLPPPEKHYSLSKSK